MPVHPTASLAILISTASLLALGILGLATRTIVHVICAKRDAVQREQRRRNELRSLAADILNARALVRESISRRDVDVDVDPELGAVKHDQAAGKVEDGGKRVGEQQQQQQRDALPRKEVEDEESEHSSEEGEDIFQEVGFDWISLGSRRNSEAEIDLESGQWTEIDLTRGQDEVVEPPSREQTRSPRVWMTMAPPRGV